MKPIKEVIKMGLDMYFYARKTTYKSFSKWDNPDRANEVNYPEDLKTFSDYICDRNFKSELIETTYQIGYFRKFNALHSYIVKTFANGVDDCRDIILYKEDVEQIKKVLDEVLNAHQQVEKAKELLPTQSGFFFGGTDYDEYYFEDVKVAADLMHSFLDNFDFDKYQLVYQASW